jgi:uncharacterized protein YkwD
MYDMKRILIILLAVIAAAVIPAAAASDDWAYGCFDKGEGRTRNDIFFLVNRERAGNDLPPLECDPRLSDIAQGHAEDMARRDYFSHTAPGGVGMKERLAAAGITYHLAGENIAWGDRGAESVVRRWMGSPGHRKNILGNFTKVGVGSYDRYYVLLFVRE